MDVKTQTQPNQARASFTSKSCTSVFDNINNDFMGFSERNSIIDVGQNGDTNNNFQVNYMLDSASSNSGTSNTCKCPLSFIRLRKFFKRKMASTKFKNIQIEMLYQRYLLRMNQNNAAHIVWLLFMLIFILAFIHVHFLITRWNDGLACNQRKNMTTTLDTHHVNVIDNLFKSNNTTNIYNAAYAYYDDNSSLPTAVIYDDTAAVVHDNIQETETCMESNDDAYELLGTNFIQFFLLGLCSILYTILLLCLYKQRINEIYLFHVSYAIIISLVIIDISFSITNMGK